MRRGYVHDAAQAIADHYEICETDVLLHVLPVHHATGNGVMFFPFLISGSLVEFRSGSFDAAWMWDRWRRGGLTFFSGVPTMYMRLERHFEQSLAGLLLERLEWYILGARQFRAMLCGTSALPGPISQFWTKSEAARGSSPDTALLNSVHHSKSCWIPKAQWERSSLGLRSNSPKVMKVKSLSRVRKCFQGTFSLCSYKPRILG
jgi:acyl-CoA synthetase (AMP-forming)/AMP-acid ligase II